MVIGIDASRANRDRKSGTEYYSYYLIKNLAKLDDENEYILYTDKPLKGGLLDLTTDDFDNQDDVEIKFDNKGYQIIKSPHNNFKAKVLNWPFHFFWTLGRLSLEMLLHKPDILFVPAHSIPLIYPSRTINTIHDVAFAREKKIYNSENIDSNGVRVKNFINILVRIFSLGRYGANSIDYLNWSTKFSLKHSKKIITVSEFSKKEISDVYKNKKDKIEVVYNGFNKHLYKKINDQEGINKILSKYEIEKPYFIYVGRLEKKKNIPNLIEAFAMAKQNNKNLKEKLVLLGYASYGYDEIKYLIQEFNLDDEVIMPGWIEEDEVAYLLNYATALIFPSKHEGFGIPVVQAMNCGVPAAISDIAVLREVAQDSCLYFNPHNVCTMSKAMIEITTNESLRQDLIKKGEKRAKEFSWRKCAAETLEVINKV